MNTRYAMDKTTADACMLLREKLYAQQQEDIRKRLSINPCPTEPEMILGAFIEMYQPHIQPIVLPLLQKGYAIDSSSGFDGKYFEYHSLYGPFPIDEIVINKLAKIGIKVHKRTKHKSVRFLIETVDRKYLEEKVQTIVAALPHREEPCIPLDTEQAIHFRMQYIPQNTSLQQVRLFQILIHETRKQMKQDLETRIKQNPIPDAFESDTGSFKEMIEPYVRDAVLELYKKGYSIDISGSTEKPDIQIIEGDFILDDATTQNVILSGASVITNPSGYTRIEFTPKEASYKSIKNQWDTIAQLFPDTGSPARPSMTRKSRTFRETYTR